ncbi:MAG: tyrosine-type recombinase/integrase [Syntrophorhabdaceae bacterium]
MTIQWIKTAHKGLRYYEHQERKHGKQRDRYYSIRFRVDKILYTYGVGWMSDGIPEAIRKEEPELGFQDYCLKLLRQYRGNVKTGSGPKSPKEKRSIEEARQAEEKAEAERQEKEAVTSKTFFEATYLPQAKADKKERSVTREEGLFKVWISPALGHLPMKDITPFHLEKLKRDMTAGGQSPRSVEYALSVVRQIFNTAKRLGYFDGENPTAKVKFPKPDNGRMRFLTHAEADKLLEALKIKSSDVHDMTLLSLNCGLRFGEIASLTWQDVSFDRGTLTIRDAKAGSRYAFLTEQAAAMLKGRSDEQDREAKKNGTERKPSDYVFSGRKGLLDRISITFKRTINELKFNEGIDDPRLQICFHSCRHSYASWMIEEGADLYTVQKLLGHKTNVMTQRYGHMSESRLKGAAKALSLALRPKEKTKEDAGQVANAS